MEGVLHDSGWRVCYMRVDGGCVRVTFGDVYVQEYVHPVE